jgi:hypothetical protein
LISTGRLARALALALLLGGPLAPAYSLEPVARLKGPVNAQVDVEFWLKFAGSVGDDPVELELASGPEPVNLALLYDRDGKPVYGIASVGQAGVYQFVVVATGKPEGAKKAKRAYAFWTIHVGGPQPVPPGPTPVPPGPNPTPVPPDPGSGLASYIRDIVARRRSRLGRPVDRGGLPRGGPAGPRRKIPEPADDGDVRQGGDADGATRLVGRLRPGAETQGAQARHDGRPRKGF